MQKFDMMNHLFWEKSDRFIQSLKYKYQIIEFGEDDLTE